MKKVMFEFPVSNQYTYFVEKFGKVYKMDNRNGKFEECFYHVAHGYRRIRVTDVATNTRRYIRVSRLVASYYVDNPSPTEYKIVNHIDGNKQNDTYSNLEWCNISINTKHAYDNGLVHDRGRWIAHPYSDRFKTHANTES